MINKLRMLFNSQQLLELRDSAEKYWSQTADVQVLPQLALAYAQLGQREKVEEVLERIKPHRNVLDLDAQVDLAAVLIAMGRQTQGQLVLKSALNLSPNHTQAMARLAWCKMREGAKDEARQLYAKAFAQAPDVMPIWFNLIKLCLEQNDSSTAQSTLDAAAAHLEQHSDEAPESWVKQQTILLRNLQLEIWSATAQFARAEEWFDERQRNITESDWSALVVLWSTLLAGLDRHAQAEEALRNALKHYPENIVLLEQLADLALIQGRHFQAISLLRRTLRVAENNSLKRDGILLWIKLSNAYLHGDDALAQKAAEKALTLITELEQDAEQPAAALAAVHVQARAAMARVKSQLQEFESADALFRELLVQYPYCAPALQGLGQQQLQLGNIDEAIELFNRLREIDPARGNAALINARQFPEDDASLEKMEKAARQPSIEGALHAGLLFQLAAAWEKRKDYDRAFSLALEANEANRKLLHYDPKVHRQRCAAIRHAFPRDLYEHRKEVGCDATLPVYVVGMPRSGTTLVEQILGSHSQICGAGELGVMPRVIAGLERWERHVGSDRHYPDCVDDISAYVANGIAQTVLNELREYDADAGFIVDKLPHNFENIGLIKLLFPKARIISVRRDPRDIALSNYFTDYHAKHGGMGFAYDLTNIGEQLADHNLLMHHWHQVFPGEILEINYEELIEQTPAVARRMLDYIGVPWEEQVLDFNELERPVKTASVWQVRQPIYKSSKGKWQPYAPHLAPLFRGTNARIQWEPISMLTLPEPGLLNSGVDAYNNDRFSDAERLFKKLLHHLPDHAAANFMVGLIYVRKGHLPQGIELMAKAQQKCPWNTNWRKDLIQAYELAGDNASADALSNKAGGEQAAETADDTTFALTEPASLLAQS